MHGCLISNKGLHTSQGFYTVDGLHRLFTMPFEPIPEHGVESSGSGRRPHTTMWQLSFAMPDEAAARALCSSGGDALLSDAINRVQRWVTHGSSPLSVF